MKKGFTIIEILVVVSIIAMLASITITSMSGMRAKARDTARIQTFEEIKKALELYRTDNRGYPCHNLAVPSRILLKLVPKYIPSINSYASSITIIPRFSNGSFCKTTANKGESYIMFTNLEREDNPILKTDSDYEGTNPINPSVLRISGKSKSCTDAINISPERCYDFDSSKL